MLHGDEFVEACSAQQEYVQHSPAECNKKLSEVFFSEWNERLCQFEKRGKLSSA